MASLLIDNLMVRGREWWIGGYYHVSHPVTAATVQPWHSMTVQLGEKNEFSLSAWRRPFMLR